MNKLQSIFESPLAAQFGQTMLHSLWQGVLIVAIFWVANRFIKKAENKVWLGLSAFGLQFLASVLTFIVLMPEKSSEALANTPESPVLWTQIVSDPASQNFLETIQSNAHWLFAGWLIGFSFLVLRQFGGLFYVQYLKTTGIKELNQKADKALDNVLSKIDIRIPSFKAFQSDKVSTAMVLGSLKPVLLLPVSLVSGLSNEQLELIIAHEIAHIKRNDFAINLSQTLLENLFFYHPAYWLVSYQIRENREHACDDWAADLTGNRVLLAKTLAQIQLNQQHPSLAMAFGKKRMPMLGRIQRLLGINPKTQQIKLMATLVVIAALSTVGVVKAQTEEVIDIEPFEELSEPEIIDEKAEIVEIAPSIEPKAIVSDSERVDRHIFYGFGDEIIELKNDEYKVKIDPNSITINGKTLNLSPAERAELTKHWKEIAAAKKELEEKTANIQIDADKIQEIHKKIMAEVEFNPANNPEFKKSIAQIQEHAKAISEHSVEFQSQIAKLDKKDPDFQKKMDKLEKEFEAKIELHEKKMEDFEVNIEGFDLKMKEMEIKIEEELEIPMKRFEAEMELKEVEIEMSAEKIEEHHDALLKMLPEAVQKSFGDRPKPPKPPKAPKPMKTPKPVKPPKPAKPLKNKVGPPTSPTPPAPPSPATPPIPRD